LMRVALLQSAWLCSHVQEERAGCRCSFLGVLVDVK